MADTDPADSDRIDRDFCINELKEEAAELAGEPLVEWEAEDAPPEAIEGFWANVVAYERADWGTNAQQLAADGIDLPPADQLSDDALPGKLRQVIDGLAARNVFLSQTDHLSDRELYAKLAEDLLHEPTKLIDDPEWNCHLDILGSYGPEDMEVFHRYYATEEDRQRWSKEWPDDPMPPRENPPYDRDRHLPKPRR